jgi:hypothetical protein
VADNKSIYCSLCGRQAIKWIGKKGYCKKHAEPDAKPPTLGISVSDKVKQQDKVG